MDSLIKDILSYHVICNVIIPHHAITSDGGAASQWPHTHASYLSLCWLAFLIQTTDGIIIIRIWPTDIIGVRNESHITLTTAGRCPHMCRLPQPGESQVQAPALDHHQTSSSRSQAQSHSPLSRQDKCISWMISRLSTTCYGQWSLQVLNVQSACSFVTILL